MRAWLATNRHQLIKLRLIEGLFLTTAGAMAGTPAGMAALRRTLYGYAASAPLQGSTQGTVLKILALTGISLLTAAVAAIGPALRASHAKLSSVLNDGSSRASSSVQGTPSREMFIAIQAALAVPLVIAASATVKRFADLQTTSIEFEPAHVLARISHSPSATTADRGLSVTGGTSIVAALQHSAFPCVDGARSW